MKLRNAVRNVFVQLSDSIERLTQAQFTQACNNLSGSTIGQHTRHIIEMFQCLENGYTDGVVDYENRKRDLRIESDKVMALRLLKEVYNSLDRGDRELGLATYYDDTVDGSVVIQTNYNREVAYNLEHTIHHMALMRVGITEISDIVLSPEYGLASSTIKYRKECVQ